MGVDVRLLSSLRGAFNSFFTKKSKTHPQLVHLILIEFHLILLLLCRITFLFSKISNIPRRDSNVFTSRSHSTAKRTARIPLNRNVSSNFIQCRRPSTSSIHCCCCFTCSEEHTHTRRREWDNVVHKARRIAAQEVESTSEEGWKHEIGCLL